MKRSAFLCSLLAPLGFSKALAMPVASTPQKEADECVSRQNHLHTDEYIYAHIDQYAQGKTNVIILAKKIEGIHYCKNPIEKYNRSYGLERSTFFHVKHNKAKKITVEKLESILSQGSFVF